MGLPAPPGIVQNEPAPLIIDDPPFLDLVDGAKTSQAGPVIIQAAIADAG